MVEFSDNGVAVGLTDSCQAFSFREVLSLQAVEVLVTAALPRVVRVSEEAFTFYAEHLADTIGIMLRVKDSPIPASSESHGQKIVHANICIDGVDLAGGDVDPDRYESPNGFYVLLGVASEDKVRSAFNALQIGGHVVLTPQRTFWSPCYAIVVDRFGVPWKINCGT